MKKVIILIVFTLVSSCSDQMKIEQTNEVKNYQLDVDKRDIEFDLNVFDRYSFGLLNRKNRFLSFPSIPTHNNDVIISNVPPLSEAMLYGPVNIRAGEKYAYTLVVPKQLILSKDIDMDNYLYSVELFDEVDMVNGGFYSSDALDHMCLFNSNTVNITFPSNSSGDTYVLFYTLYEPVPEDLAQNECRMNVDKYITKVKTIHISQ